MDRRHFIGTVMGMGAALTFLPTHVKGLSSKRQLRIVHITDMHIFPSHKVKKAMSKLIEEIESLDKPADFILNTGDNIMDSLQAKKENVHEQWQAWLKYFRNKISLPLYSCIGNHDVWGWGLDDKNIENDPLYGKTWAVSMLDIPHRYYSFIMNNWKFICLDSSGYDKNRRGYTAKLDHKQFAWLKEELANTRRDIPVCIASHIPILSASVFFDGDNVKNGEWEIPGAWMHTDAKKLKNLFNEFSNVRAAFSGHVHLADKTEYLGVKYFCNGAVCGGWWRGKYQEFGPAYAIVDFYEDGRVESELVPYKF